MDGENCLWGAPRIHGELLKLGMAISERTVSRYLRGRPPRRSQTWRTFFANHFGDPTPISVMFADARGDDVVVDASDVSFCPTQLSINGSWAADCGLPLQPTVLGTRLRQDHLWDRTGGARKSTGRDPPHPWLQLPRRSGHEFRCVPCRIFATEGNVRPFSRAFSVCACRPVVHSTSINLRDEPD